MKRQFFKGMPLNINELNISEEWSKFQEYRTELNLAELEDFYMKYNVDGSMVNYVIIANCNEKQFICSYGGNEYQICEYEEKRRHTVSTDEGKLVTDELTILSDNLKFFNLFPVGDYMNYSLGYRGEACSGLDGYCYYEITKDKEVIPIADEELPARGYTIIIHGMRKTSENSATSDGGNIHIIR